jgi:hypothetical protein
LVTPVLAAQEKVALEHGSVLPEAGDARIAGAGLMVNVAGEEVPPPGVGLKTVTEAVPGDAMSAAGT